MVQRLRLLTAGLILATGPAYADTTTIALVNAIGDDVASLDARKTGTSSWSTVPYAARAGTGSPVTFDTQDCAWDLRLKLTSGDVVNYGNVNVCEVKLVTLHRRNGTLWVDYD